MAEEKHHHLFHHRKEEESSGEVNYEKEEKHHKHLEQLGGLGAIAAGAYAIVRSSIDRSRRPLPLDLLAYCICLFVCVCFGVYAEINARL